MLTNTRHFNAREINLLIHSHQYPLDKPVDADIPVEYITGEAEFLGNYFTVSPHTLIPRIETEALVSLVINYIQTNFVGSESVTLVDVGTGSGCIGISVGLGLYRQNFPTPTQFYLLDSSAEALAITQKNLTQLVAKKHQENFLIKKSDLLTELLPSLSIDVIVANLPYIPTSRIEQLESSVKKFEPATALDGGTDGLSLINKLINQISQLKTKPKAIFLEIDHTHNQINLPKLPEYDLKIVTDINAHNRYALYQSKVQLS